MYTLEDLYQRCDVSNNQIDAIGFAEFEQRIKAIFLDTYTKAREQTRNEHELDELMTKAIEDL
jgi:hypothetical protein